LLIDANVELFMYDGRVATEPASRNQALVVEMLYRAMLAAAVDAGIETVPRPFTALPPALRERFARVVLEVIGAG